MALNRSEYVRRFNDVIAAVSDSGKEEARAILRYLLTRILDEQDAYYFRRLCDDLMVAWYDTYKNRGKGPWLPKESAGIQSSPE